MSSKLRGTKTSSSSFSITIQHRRHHHHQNNNNHYHNELPLKASCSSGDTASHSFTSASTISEASEHDISELLRRRQEVRDMLTKAIEVQERKRDDFRRMMDHKQSTVNAHLEQDNEYGMLSYLLRRMCGRQR